MKKFIVLLLITVLHYSLPFPRCYWDEWNGWQGCDRDQDGRDCYWDEWNGWQGCDRDQDGRGCYWDEWGRWQGCDSDEEENYSPITCPEGESLLSTEDIIDMIDYIAERLHLEEKILDDYNNILENSTNNCLKKLNDFHERLVDRPKHIEHILEEMANKRRQLESEVYLVADRMEKVDTYSHLLYVLGENGDKVLAKFDMYKTICQFNCEDSENDKWRGSQKYIRTVFRKYPNKVCWKIKDLYYEITEQLNDFRREIDRQMYEFTDSFDEGCNDFVLTYIRFWKQAAIEHYSTVMYDILSLQDDYYHFAQFITNVNESLNSEHLGDNISIIEGILLTLDDDVNKYGVHCMNCDSNTRLKRGVSAVRTGWKSYGYYDDTEYPDYDYDGDIVFNLIYRKTQIIKETIGNKFGKFLEYINEYNTRYSDYDINDLLPIEEVVRHIDREQEAFEALRSVVPEYSINRIMGLVNKSEEILTNLENAKGYIDAVLTS